MSRALKISIAVLVTVGSLVWVLWLLGAAWQDLVARRHELSIQPLVVGTALVTAGSGFMFGAFVQLVRAFRITSANGLALAHMYYVAQLLKHLPGRIWGLGYQWMAAGREGSLAGWVLANAAHMALGLYFAIWSACFVIALGHSGMAGLLALMLGLAGYFLAWKVGSSEPAARMVARLPGRLGTIGAGAPAAVGATSSTERVYVLAFLAAGWLVHYAGWWFYGTAYPQLGGWPAVHLCACYMLAWVAGYVSVVTPSGLGVRELVFVWLAKDYPADVVALMTILGRASLLAVDLLLGMIFAPFVSQGHRDGRQA